MHYMFDMPVDTVHLLLCFLCFFQFSQSQQISGPVLQSCSSAVSHSCPVIPSCKDEYVAGLRSQKAVGISQNKHKISKYLLFTIIFRKLGFRLFTEMYILGCMVFKRIILSCLTFLNSYCKCIFD